MGLYSLYASAKLEVIIIQQRNAYVFFCLVNESHQLTIKTGIAEFQAANQIDWSRALQGSEKLYRGGWRLRQKGKIKKRQYVYYYQ